MQRSHATLILRIHIRTSGNKQFGDFLVTGKSRTMQRSETFLIFRIQIRTFGDKQFGDFLVTT